MNYASKFMCLYLSRISDCIVHLTLCLPHHCSSLSSLPGVWTLLGPQGALSLRLSLPTPLRQQDLHVLLPPQQHSLQVLLQRDWVPDGHADQPHHHLWWLCTQVSDNNNNKNSHNNSNKDNADDALLMTTLDDGILLTGLSIYWQRRLHNNTWQLLWCSRHICTYLSFHYELERIQCEHTSQDC